MSRCVVSTVVVNRFLFLVKISQFVDAMHATIDDKSVLRLFPTISFLVITIVSVCILECHNAGTDIGDCDVRHVSCHMLNAKEGL